MEHKKAKKAVKMAEQAMRMMELEDAMEEMAKRRSPSLHQLPQVIAFLQLMKHVG